jgi:antitoxin MazE
VIEAESGDTFLLSESPSFMTTLLLRGGIMPTTIRRLRNSRGILIPGHLLQQTGLGDQVEIRVEGHKLIVRRPGSAPRAGWAEASKKLAASGDDELVWPEFANEADADFEWTDGTTSSNPR